VTCLFLHVKMVRCCKFSLLYEWNINGKLERHNFNNIIKCKDAESRSQYFSNGKSSMFSNCESLLETINLLFTKAIITCKRPTKFGQQLTRCFKIRQETTAGLSGPCKHGALFGCMDCKLHQMHGSKCCIYPGKR